MRIIIKDFKSLIKAVQNRAHLFPVKVLINGKNKTFYGIRYKSGNKAMEIAKKQMKLPENIEVSFDSKDGKAKGLSEKEVLDLYTKAGKHGSLQDFIASNFKRPKVKSDQLSITDIKKPEKKNNPAKNNLIEEIKNNELVNKLAAEDKVLKEKRSSKAVKGKIKAKEKKLTGEQAGKFRYRLGTKKIDPKHEYQEVKTTNELVEKIKPIKDMHTDIKGRAIMDMLGLNIPLYSKRNGKLFNVLIAGEGTGAAGLCRVIPGKDGSRINKEICLVAETNNPSSETKTAIHECMHAKISETVTADPDKLCTPERRKSLKSLEETLVETAGQAISNLVHGKDTDRQIHSYSKQIARCLPCIWDLDEFKNVRKEGTHGIGREIFKQLTAKNGDFLAKVLDKYQASKKDPVMSNKYKAIETKIKERTDKVEKIQQDTGKSDIANLVEELKRGTISLEGALNSSKYREIAAVLITKFLEDEDLDAIETLALSF